MMAKGIPVAAEAVRVTCEWAASAPAALLAPVLAGSGLGLAHRDQAGVLGPAAAGQPSAERAGPPGAAAGGPGAASAIAAVDESGLAQRRALAVALLAELASEVCGSGGSTHAGEAGGVAAGPGSMAAPGSGAPDPMPGPKTVARPAAPPLQAALFGWLDARAAREAGGGAADPAGLGGGTAPAERALQALLVALTGSGLFCPAAYQGMLIARVRSCCILPKFPDQCCHL